MNVEAAPGVTAMLTRFNLAYAFALRGTGYAYAPRDGAGELTMIDGIHPDLCTVLRNGRARFYDFEDGDRIQRRVPGRAMVHMRYMAEDGWTGRSPISVAAESFGIALAGQEAAARAASGTFMIAVAKVSAFDADEETYQRSKVRLREALRNENSLGGVTLIGPDDDIKNLDLSAAASWRCMRPRRSPCWRSRCRNRWLVIPSRWRDRRPSSALPLSAASPLCRCAAC
ncbi:phage portal protein [Pseudooceanicola spongiae]|uniref:phage portal protein n=1 Tax=Pseudooceanicola spongiae TaxID=2613965 RepID=UPI0021F80C9A|nr:phage portal protein [Pseudooceanicola spongiae]